MSSALKSISVNPASERCQLAFLILKNAHDTSSSFLETFQGVRKVRSARGTPTDEEQDLLRAMLSFSCAGLDSMVKQLVRDALPELLQNNQGAIENFRVFVERRIRQGESIDYKLLSEVFTDHDPRRKLESKLIRELTAKSLQSTEEILKVASYFDIPSNELIQNTKSLSEIFKVRNEIVHEMDVDFAQPNRNRRPRARQTMVKHTNLVFDVCSHFLSQVDQRMPT